MTTLELPEVHAFEDPLPHGAEPSVLLGGKAAGLAVMARDLGLPVPPGFVVTTRVCHEYLNSGWPRRLDSQIRDHLHRLGERTGRIFGDSEAPLLLSVRSGAPVSMPGMMDTLLNVGMTPQIRERLAEESGSEEFAADTWLRFNRMYAETVLGVPRDDLASIAMHDGSAPAMLAAAARIRDATAAFGGVPEDPFDQLREAISTVFASWECERAHAFRSREGISVELGTAATVQAMVFGNLDDHSGSGVAFTRDPSSGERKPTGDYLARAQGEDVVAGTHRVRGLEALHEQLPTICEELFSTMDRIERHYRDMCDIEFTVSKGTLYLLQTRVGRRSPLAAIRIAVDMAEDPEFPLTRAEAMERANEDTIAELARLGAVRPGAVALASGLAASPGVGTGVLCTDAGRAAELAASGQAVVLARPETSPSDVHGMAAAVGLVTTLGGIMSHAAVVARGWAIPAVCSLEGASVERGGLRAGDTFIAEGEVVTIDGTGGHLFLGDQREDGALDLPELQKLREWAGDVELAEAAATQDGAVVSAFEVLRVVSLKGLCTAERAAGVLRASEAAVAEVFDAHAHILKPTARGVALTADGRAWIQEQLAAERALFDSSALERPFAEFLPLNQRLKAFISEAQLGGITSSDHANWPELRANLEALHTSFRPVAAAAGAVAPRLALYVSRFDAAMAAFVAGDHSMLASPLKDSYHTVWFEFHEEMIALTGRDRATEEAVGH